VSVYYTARLEYSIVAYVHFMSTCSVMDDPPGKVCTCI